MCIRDSAMINEELKRAVMGDIVLLSLIGIKAVSYTHLADAAYRDRPAPGQ